ncbi:MAG: IS110 family transposase [Anaerolineales bacterium]|nr:IS110 family transposase [Anaerolineales bacterium]
MSAASVVATRPPAIEKGVSPPALTTADHLALLAFGRADLPELTHRRRYFAAVERFVGLDIHRDYFVATAVDHELRVVYGPRRATWEQFERWIAETLTPADAVVVEMTTNTWQVHDALAPHVHSVTVVHPPHVKLITQAPVMNDKKAAEALAMLHAAGLLRSIWVPDQTVRDRRQLVAQRHDRVRAATIAKNRLHSILHRHSLDRPDSSLPFSPKRQDFWRSLPVSPVEKLAIELDLETVEQADRQRERLEAFMAKEALTDDRIPFLVQLPGISTIGALTILAAIGPIERFPSAKALVGYSGLGGRVHDSGQTHTGGRITKTGRRDLRGVLVNAAQAASRSADYWKAELARLEPRLGRNKAMVALARKMLVIVWHVLTKREADKRANAQKVAENFLNTIYTHIGARRLPDGQTAPEFVRRWLDRLGIGKELQRVTRAGHSYLLPQSSQPGAPPAAQPKGNGRSQNTKAAQEQRLADAAAKREALAMKQAEAEARMGRPRKTRSDKGTKRGPQKGKAK